MVGWGGGIFDYLNYLLNVGGGGELTSRKRWQGPTAHSAARSGVEGVECRVLAK